MNLKKILPACTIALLATSAHAQPQQPPKPPGNEERLKHVTERINKELTLTAAQKSKVETAYKDFFVEMDKLRSKNGNPSAPPPPPPPPPGKKEDVEKLTKARDAKIKTALSEAQFKKYSEIEKSLRPPRPGEAPGKQGPPPPPKQ